jgi:hypothetical protein
MIISPRPSLQHTSGTSFHLDPNRLAASIGYVKARWHRQAIAAIDYAQVSAFPAKPGHEHAGRAK